MLLPAGVQLQMPRPKTFLGLMSLESGTELIALLFLFNKATGLYGLLAILTGFHLSALQLSMYLYSVVALGILAYCLPHIRKQTPFQNLAFAWLYVIDTVVNTGYTTVFAVSWYLASSKTGGPTPPEDADTGVPLTAFMKAIDTTASTSFIVAFSLIRVYFALVIMAHAQAVIAQHRDGKQQGWTGSETPEQAGTLFAEGTPDGEGYKGKIGRAMISVGRGFWLGGQKQDDEWAKNVRSKFRSNKIASA
ncbi:inositol phoshorylceramide synthase regulatory subunit kei1 [Apiospora kogelbergensis]|uniref:Inositol phoshorylceramide synthase regulatory subunit kei1 n=1 Tax=Apiospora kogelbergensis TaxID=1337665 RepID=A0AAW0QLY5_9PEZI